MMKNEEDLISTEMLQEDEEILAVCTFNKSGLIITHALGLHLYINQPVPDIWKGRRGSIYFTSQVSRFGTNEIFL